MKNRQLPLLAAAGLIWFSAFFIPQAKAGDFDRLTKVQINQPFEIPGMVLPPGTYTLRLISQADGAFRAPDVVVVANATDQHVYKMVQAIPVSRSYDNPAPDHAIITFEERAAGAPQAIKDWWYPGLSVGEEFIYPKPHTILTASAAPLPVPAPVPPPPAPQAAPAPPPPAPPVETAQAQPAPEQQAAPEPPAAQPETTPQQLPKTGSDLPLIGLLGMVSAGAGLALRKLA